MTRDPHTASVPVAPQVPIAADSQPMADYAPTIARDRTTSDESAQYEDWNGLSVGARVYIANISAVGLIAVIWSLQALTGPNSLLVGGFILCSLVASMIKVSFPGGRSTLTLCQVLDYLSLLLLGLEGAVLVAAGGAWAQCSLNSKVRPATYQTVFSVSSLAISMGSGVGVYFLLGGQPGVFDWSTSLGPFTAAATAFFLVNSGLVSAAIGLSGEQSVLRVWSETCLWSWQGYLLGAAIAAAAVAGVQNGRYWLVPFFLVALVLTFFNLRAYLERVADAQTDSLTGLPNQRSLMTHLHRAVERARRRRSSLAVVIIDVDQFKAINDTHGHRAGDLALVKIAECLRKSVDPRDVCGRYAGDEFLMILDRCDAEHVERKAHELQRAVAAQRVGRGPDVRIPLAISVGSAIFPDDATAVEELLAAADARMYQDKRGRDQVKPLLELPEAIEIRSHGDGDPPANGKPRTIKTGLNPLDCSPVL